MNETEDSKPPLKDKTQSCKDRVLTRKLDVVLPLEGIRLPVYPFGFGYCMPHRKRFGETE